MIELQIYFSENIKIPFLRSWVQMKMSWVLPWEWNFTSSGLDLPPVVLFQTGPFTEAKWAIGRLTIVIYLLYSSNIHKYITYFILLELYCLFFLTRLVSLFWAAVFILSLPWFKKIAIWEKYYYIGGVYHLYYIVWCGPVYQVLTCTLGDWHSPFVISVNGLCAITYILLMT